MDWIGVADAEALKGGRLVKEKCEESHWEPFMSVRFLLYGSRCFAHQNGMAVLCTQSSCLCRVVAFASRLVAG